MGAHRTRGGAWPGSLGIVTLLSALAGCDSSELAPAQFDPGPQLIPVGERLAPCPSGSAWAWSLSDRHIKFLSPDGTARKVWTLPAVPSSVTTEESCTWVWVRFADPFGLQYI